MQLFDTSKHFFKKKNTKKHQPSLQRGCLQRVFLKTFLTSSFKVNKKITFSSIIIRNEISKKSNFYMKNNFTFRQKLSKNKKWSFKKKYKKTSAEPSVRLSEKSIPQNISRKNPKFPKNRIFT